MSRRIFGGLLVLLPLSGLLISHRVPARAPVKASVTLDDEVIVRAKEIAVNQFRLTADGKWAFVVGGVREKADDETPPRDPQGYRVDLTAKTTTRFLNDHTGPILDLVLSPNGKRVWTVGQAKDAVVRVWDADTNESASHADFTKEVDELDSPALAHLPPQGTVATVLDEGIAIVGKKADDRTDLRHVEFGRTGVKLPTVDREGKRLAAASLRGKILVWDLKSAEPVAAVDTVPEGVDYRDWRISDLKYAPTAPALFFCRYGPTDDVPADEEEAKVPADRRAVWIVDAEKGTAKPLGLGQTVHSYRLAIHPTDRWLAVVGRSRGEGEFEKKPAAVGEIRVYDLGSNQLAFKRQFGEFDPMWVEFADGGKRIACASPQGEVRSWRFRVGER